jgi:hypothetical protein
MKLQQDINSHTFVDLLEVDESQFGRRKNNVGRIGNTDCFFEMCEGDADERVYIVKVDQRDAQTLCSVIFSCAYQGTVVISDGWSAYPECDKLGYIHLWFNHYENFVDPTLGINTQRIESWWAAAKKWMRKHSDQCDECREDYISEWCWKYNLRFSFQAIWTSILKE